MDEGTTEEKVRLPDTDVDAVIAAWSLGGREAAEAAAKAIIGGKPRLRKVKRAWHALVNEAHARICAEERRLYPQATITIGPESWPGGPVVLGDTVTIGSAGDPSMMGRWRVDGITSGRIKLKR